MNFNPFRRFRRKSAVPTGIRTFHFGVGGDTAQLTNFPEIAKRGYSGNADVYAAVKRYGDALGGIPWVVRTKTVNKRRTDWDVMTEHPFYDLWNRPNPTQTQSEWMQQFVAYHWLGGEVFISVSGTLPTTAQSDQGRKVGEPKELWLTRPDHIKEIKAGAKGKEIKSFMYQPDPKVDPKPWPAVNVDALGNVKGDTFYMRFVNPLDPWRGMSPFVPAAIGIMIGIDARHWDWTMMKSGGTPLGALLVPEGDDSDDQKKEKERQFLNKWNDHSGMPMMLHAVGDDGQQLMHWIEMGKTPKELDWDGAIRLSTQDVSKVTSVPPPLLADYEHAIFNNVGAAHKQFWTDGVIPYIDGIRDMFNAYLLPFYGQDVWLDYDLSKVPALREDQNELWARIKDAKFLLVDEARQMAGMEPFPNKAGQVLILGSGDIPTAPEDLGEFASLENTPNDPDLGNDGND